VTESVVCFENVDIVFGENPGLALPLIDAGKTREEIQKATGQTLGVANCSLEVSAGEVLVLMGLSGSGKSTLLRAVNGLNPVARGHVKVRRQIDATWRDPHSCTASELRELRLDWVSMVFQQFALLPWRTVEENVGFGLELARRSKSLSKLQAKTIVRDQLKLVGLEDWADKQVQELSGGMQQRVGLARAFATDAPILLMDEPYSALDPLIRSRLQDELLELQKRLHRTILFVSHDLDEAMKIGNRIAIMEGGRIVQCGTPVEIFTNPASQYVTDFVSHINPLHIITAEHAMQSGNTRAAGHDRAIAVARETNLQEVMKVHLDTGLPVYVEDNGHVIGVITEREIYRTLLMKPA